MQSFITCSGGSYANDRTVSASYTDIAIARTQTSVEDVIIASIVPGIELYEIL